MDHDAQIVKGSTKRSKSGGIEWTVSCCGEVESRGHIQNPGMFSLEELKRIQDDHVAEVQAMHESHARALEFLQGQEDSGCEPCGK